MARWVRWTEEELDLLVEFYLRVGIRPTEGELWAFRGSLQDLAAQRGVPRVKARSFRSHDSIRSHLYHLRLIESADPRAQQQASKGMWLAWERSRPDPKRSESASGFVDPSESEEGVEARAILGKFLIQLRDVMDGFSEHALTLMSALNAGNFRAGWADLGRGGNLETALEALNTPGIGPELRSHGLDGVQLVAKTDGFFAAVKRIAGRLTWDRLRPALRWANVILGSLAQIPVFVVLEPVKEMKEVGEAGAEEEDERKAAEV